MLMYARRYCSSSGRIRSFIFVNTNQIHDSCAAIAAVLLYRHPFPSKRVRWCLSKCWHGSCAPRPSCEPQNPHHSALNPSTPTSIYRIWSQPDDDWNGPMIFFKVLSSRLVRGTGWVLAGHSSINYCCWHLQICANIKVDFRGLFLVMEVRLRFHPGGKDAEIARWWIDESGQPWGNGDKWADKCCLCKITIAEREL